MIQSRQLFEKSCSCIAGGVNSPVRAFHGVGGNPLFFSSGEGAWVTDANSKHYIDYVCAWGAIIAGHAHPRVVDAVQKKAAYGLGFGAPTEIEYRFADKLTRLLPSLELVRLVNSGTEATMSAIRVARGFTKRPLLVKFSGCYHGHADCLLAQAGSGVLTLGISSSLGVPEHAVKDTVVLPYNDAQAAAECFARHGDQIAAVIVEPIAGNMNLIPGHHDFLQQLRKESEAHGAVLIFDEVMSGFRVGAGSAQGLVGITPDLTCLGKVIGGGLNVAAFGGQREIMRMLAPLGEVYQAGTLSGNPVALSAGLASLEVTEQEGFYDTLQQHSMQLANGLMDAAKRAGVRFCAHAIGGMLGLYFADSPPASLKEAQESFDLADFRTFFHAMLAEGVYLAPSAYEACFTSIAHNENIVRLTVTAAEKAFARMASEKPTVGRRNGLRTH